MLRFTPISGVSRPGLPRDLLTCAILESATEGLRVDLFCPSSRLGRGDDRVFSSMPARLEPPGWASASTEVKREQNQRGRIKRTHRDFCRSRSRILSNHPGPALQDT